MVAGLFPSQHETFQTAEMEVWDPRGVVGRRYRHLTRDKIDGRHIHPFSSGYMIIAANAPSKHQGGITLCARENNLFEVEETQI